MPTSFLCNVKEFYGREFTCDAFVPAGAGYDVTGVNRACSAVGSVLGSDSVSGTTYLTAAYQYNHAHKWRNLGISEIQSHRLCTGHNN